MRDLQDMVEDFVDGWAPRKKGRARTQFIDQLRALLEAYGTAAINHESLPDTEHAHGDPI